MSFRAFGTAGALARFLEITVILDPSRAAASAGDGRSLERAVLDVLGQARRPMSAMEILRHVLKHPPLEMAAPVPRRTRHRSADRAARAQARR
jgi:hypothetical protein